MGQYTPRNDFPVSDDGEEAQSDGQTGPVALDPEQNPTPNVDWGDVQQTLAYALDETYIPSGSLADRPPAGQLAPRFFVVEDAENGPTLAFNMGSEWVAVIGGADSSQYASKTTVEALQSGLSDVQAALSSLEQTAARIDDSNAALGEDLDTASQRISQLRTDLDTGLSRYQQPSDPITAAGQTPQPGDHWVDTSSEPYAERVLNAAGDRWIRLSAETSSGDGGGVEDDPTLTIEATGSVDIDWRVTGQDLRAGPNFTANDSINSTGTEATGAVLAGNIDDLLTDPGTRPTVYASDPSATAATWDGQSVTVNQLSQRTLIDSFGHRDVPSYYSVVTNVDDISYASDSAPGGADNTAMQFDVLNSRDIVSYPGDGLDYYPSPGDTITVWTKARSAGGTSALRFAVDPADDTTYYSVFLNDELSRFLLYRTENGIDDRIGGYDGIDFNENAWYRIETQWFPNGGNNLPIYLYNEQNDLVVSDESAEDPNTGDLFGGSDRGVGVRANNSRARFDDLSAIQG
jgi:hypothetical protein